MPIYEFICLDCGNRWEKELSLKERVEYIKNGKCPKCNSNLISQIITSCGIVFKGRCWSRDGYTSLNDDKKEAEYWAKKADPNFKEEV